MDVCLRFSVLCCSV